MHDRRIGGEAHLFGNAGGLYLGAMTWWDHQTLSVWSQPIGQAISGELAGARLDLLPSLVTSWKNWLETHPETFVLVNDLDRLGNFRQEFRDSFVIGVQIGGEALAFYYADVLQAGFLQADLGEWPVLVWAADADYRVYLRRSRDLTLTFSAPGGEIVDEQTGSTWDLVRGLAVSGALQGEVLQALPSLTAYDWAWRDFYPGSAIFSHPP